MTPSKPFIFLCDHSDTKNEGYAARFLIIKGHKLFKKEKEDVTMRVEYMLTIIYGWMDGWMFNI